jgi:Flp pilus assembly pilin Flp
MMKEQLELKAVKMQIAARDLLHVEQPERGATTLEYAVAAMIIVGIVLTAMRVMGMSIASVFERAAAALGG